MTNKTAYIAIETKVRELEAKTLLACHLARRGYEVFLGQKSAIRRTAALMPKGIYLEKSTATTKTDLFKKIKSQGHAIVVHDEEGLVMLNGESYLKKRVSEEALYYVNRFLTWGENQRAIIAQGHPNHVEKLHITGHPRFDLLRPELSALFDPVVAGIHARFGRYILVNTKFATCNNHLGKEAYFRYNVEAGLFKDQREEQRWRNFFDFSEKLFHEFQGVLPRLSEAFRDHTILIRPHPSEKLETWEEFARPYPNMAVVREGNVYPWIKGAELLIHNGCTTAVESCFFDIPAITYRPIKSEESDIDLPNSVSIEACTPEDLITQVRAFLDQGKSAQTHSITHAMREKLSFYAAAIDGALATDRIADQFDSLHQSSFSNAARVGFKRRVRQELMRLFPQKFGISGGSEKLDKFEPLNAQEVRVFVNRLASQDPLCMGIKIYDFGQNCVRIRQR